MAQRAHASNAVRAAPGPSNINARCAGWLHERASRSVTSAPAFWLIDARCAAVTALIGVPFFLAKLRRLT